MTKNRDLINKVLIYYLVYSLVVIGISWLVNVVFAQVILPSEDGFMQFLQKLHSDQLRTIVFWVAHGAGITAMIIIIHVAAIYYSKKKAKEKLVFILLSTNGVFLINIILKHLFHQNYPAVWQTIVVEKNLSFPSGHGLATSVVIFSIYFLIDKPQYRQRFAIFGVIYLLIVGFSRLYLSLHYPLDMLGAWVISFVWVVIVDRLFKSYVEGW